MRYEKLVGELENFPTYEEREVAKKVGWNKLTEYESKGDYQAAAYPLLHYIIAADYWRAREALEAMKDYKKNIKKIMGKKYFTGYLLDIDHYTNHWLAANGHRKELFAKETVQALQDEFGYEPEANKYLPKGMSIYQGFEDGK